jgi:hypothetical protein
MTLDRKANGCFSTTLGVLGKNLLAGCFKCLGKDVQP